MKTGFTQIGTDLYHGETLVGRVNSRGEADLNPAGMSLLMSSVDVRFVNSAECQCNNKYWNDHCIQCGKPTGHKELSQLKADKVELVEALDNLAKADTVSGPDWSPLREKARALIAKHSLEASKAKS